MTARTMCAHTELGFGEGVDMTNAIIKFQPRRNQIYAWDALQLAQHMPSESVNCIVSSPPYFGLRDYKMTEQMGLERGPVEYVDRLVLLFRELRRILRSDGTLWLNLGDSYVGALSQHRDGGSQGHNSVISKKTMSGVPAAGRVMRNRALYESGLEMKQLIGIPWMVAFALRADGWYLRSDIIWSKPNPMPESVTDRPTKAHEYIFLLSKSPRYWYDADAIREENAGVLPYGDKHNFKMNDENAQGKHGKSSMFAGGTRQEYIDRYYTNGRNRRTVWEVTTKPFHGAHFATFPEDLIEPMILAGCPKTCCAKCGAPYERDTEVTYTPSAKSRGKAGNGTFLEAGAGNKSGGWNDYPSLDKHVTTLGFIPTCTCNASTRAGLVYDPFMGAGTTGLVAQRLGRDYLGSELNPEYAAMARARIDGRMNEYLAMKAGKPYMEGLFTETA